MLSTGNYLDCSFNAVLNFFVQMGLAFTQRACKPCRTAANEVAFLSQKTRTAIIAWIWDARVLCERARKIWRVQVKKNH